MDKFFILGPCSAESLEQLLGTATAISAVCRNHDISQEHVIFRAGLWKPRTSPQSFEGVGSKGLSWLDEVRRSTGMRVATEVATAQHLRLCAEHRLDAVWIGARATTNPFMVEELATKLAELATNDGWKPIVILKNPVSADINLWTGAVERLRRHGISNIILLHRGFSAIGQDELRNPPLWSNVLRMRRLMPEMKMLCDVSHIAGKRPPIPHIANQAMQLALDGLMIEVHHHPEQALSDADQQLSPAQLDTLLSQLIVPEQGHADRQLTEYRQTLDDIDSEIWQLIARRQQVARDIGDYKREHHLPVFQPDRLEQILQERLLWAKQHNLSEDTVRTIIEAIHNDSVRTQIE